MKTYTVTLAQLAWVKGTITVQAESWAEAFALAKSDDFSFRASWPVGDDGDTIVGFGDVEVDGAYCPDEPETDHEGEAPAADVEVYRAAPRLLAMLIDLLKPGSVNGAVIEAGRDLLAELGHDVRKTEG